MKPLVFGVTPPPTGKGDAMAYVARHRTCGHILQVVPEKDVIDLLSGVLYSREPLKDATEEAAARRCAVCVPPEQIEAFG